MDWMIEVEGLVKTFGHLTAVDGVTFNVPKGEVLGFLGPNGACWRRQISSSRAIFFDQSSEPETLGAKSDHYAARFTPTKGACPRSDSRPPRRIDRCFPTRASRGRPQPAARPGGCFRTAREK